MLWIRVFNSPTDFKILSVTKSNCRYRNQLSQHWICEKIYSVWNRTISKNFTCSLVNWTCWRTKRKKMKRIWERFIMIPPEVGLFQIFLLLRLKILEHCQDHNFQLWKLFLICNCVFHWLFNFISPEITIMNVLWNTARI